MGIFVTVPKRTTLAGASAFFYRGCQHDWEFSKIIFFSLGTVLANEGLPVP